MRNELDDRKIEQAYEPALSPESPVPWYPVPPAGRNLTSWQAVAVNGCVAASFDTGEEGRRDCEFACRAVNMMAEWLRDDEERKNDGVEHDD